LKGLQKSLGGVITLLAVAVSSFLPADFTLVFKQDPFYGNYFGLTFNVGHCPHKIV
jgi:hypothetical protein